MIRIMHFCSDSGIGGAVVTLLRLLAAADKERFEHVVVLPKNSLMSGEFKKLDVKVIEYNNSSDTSFSFDLIIELARMICEHRPHIIHTHGLISARIAGKLCGVRCLLYTRHTYSETKSSRFSSAINKMVTTVAVSVSHALTEQIEHCGINKKDIVIIENGCDKISCTDERFAEDKTVYELLYLGRIVKDKGLLTALKAIKKINCNYMRVHLTIAGEGEYLPCLKKAAVHLGVADQVTFLPYQAPERAQKLVCGCDIAVNCSYKNEATSNFIIEALSACKPVVLSCVSGNIFIIDDGADGRFYTSGNANELARAVLDIISMPETYKLYCENAKAKYEKRFTLTLMKDKYEKLWRDEYKKHYK